MVSYNHFVPLCRSENRCPVDLSFHLIRTGELFPTLQCTRDVFSHINQSTSRILFLMHDLVLIHTATHSIGVNQIQALLVMYFNNNRLVCFTLNEHKTMRYRYKPKWLIFHYTLIVTPNAWWHHQMETFSALLALHEGNPPVTGVYPSQSPVAQSFDLFFDLHMNKRLSKQSRHRWSETPSRSLSRHRNGTCT